MITRRAIIEAFLLTLLVGVWLLAQNKATGKHHKTEVQTHGTR